MKERDSYVLAPCPAAQNESKKKCLCVALSSGTTALLLSLVALAMSGTSLNKSSAISQPTQTFFTYERIGSNKCPDVTGTSLVYYGFTAGFQTVTGATTFSCLPIPEQYISYYSPAESEYTNSSEFIS